MITKIKREIKKKLKKQSINDPAEIIKLFKQKLLFGLEYSIEGIYIIGSYGLNDFNLELSDIDFIVTLKEELKKSQFDYIRDTHIEIEKHVLQPNLNGIYILSKDLGKDSHGIDHLTYFHEGELNRVSNKSEFYEINPITWVELLLNGITIFGIKKNELNFKINWKEVNSYMYQNINSYWKKWLDKSKNPFHLYYYLTLLRRRENAWCVSGVARQLYTLNEQKITSKRKACEYFKNKVPNEYSRILSDTINFRSNQKSRPSWNQKRDTLKFVEFCINRFNDEYQRKHSS